MTDEWPHKPKRHAVLEVFGITLEVSNPRLAELLTMDAGEALTSDVRELLRQDRRSIAEALPDSVVALPTPHDQMATRARQEFRGRTDSVGAALGFDVETDGTWCSSKGIDIVTRIVERPFTAAAAAHYVSEVATMTERLPQSTAVLFVVEGPDTAESFKVAIRHRGMHDRMRTVTIEKLEEIGEMFDDGRIDHAEVLILLAPIANIDIGETMNMLRASRPPSGGQEAGA